MLWQRFGSKGLATDSWQPGAVGREGAASIAKLPLIAICERRRLVAGRAEELPEMNESLSAKLSATLGAVVELDFLRPESA